MMSSALIVIDVQNDFCSGGNCAVPEGEAVVPVVNRLARHFDHVVGIQDWHPTGHSSFASQHEGKKPYDIVTLEYGEQTLWPDHCIQGSHGAEFHKDLDTSCFQAIIRKGFRHHIDSYSAFFENDRTTPTGITGYLNTCGVKKVFLVGLATDYCVGYSALDAAAAGYDVTLVMDACRGIGKIDMEKTKILREMTSLGVKFVTSEELNL